ncbi:hypothetical protein R1flu_027927 [Riccia fluitans]|uniref:Uncharacterized protein n=1 Tax=Riccia fluitans TaxID=41844 RepID=A0ABD1XK73_9MARC
MVAHNTALREATRRHGLPGSSRLGRWISSTSHHFIFVHYPPRWSSATGPMVVNTRVAQRPGPLGGGGRKEEGSDDVTRWSTVPTLPRSMRSSHFGRHHVQVLLSTRSGLVSYSSTPGVKFPYGLKAETHCVARRSGVPRLLGSGWFIHRGRA